MCVIQTAHVLILYFISVVTCPILVQPQNGDVEHPNGVEFGSTALYTCDSGYVIGSGDLERACQANGTWGGSEAVCVGEEI